MLDYYNVSLAMQLKVNHESLSVQIFYQKYQASPWMFDVSFNIATTKPEPAVFDLS